MDSIRNLKALGFIFLLVITMIGMTFIQNKIFKDNTSTEKLSQFHEMLVKQFRSHSQELERQSNILKKLQMQTAPKEKKYLVYKCVGRIGTVHCSGWGNRLIGIVAVYTLALATDRTFGIIMNNPCELTDFLVPNNYKWNLTMSMFKNMSSISIDVRNNNLYTNSLTMMNFNAKYPVDVVFIAANQDYLKQLQQNSLYRNKVPFWDIASMYKNVFQHLFKPNPVVQKLLDSFLKKAKPKPGTTLICAQIRMGKNPTIRWDNRVLSSKKDVDVVWRYFNKTQSNSSIFVTTDSEEMRQLAKSYYGKRFVDTPGPIIHMDKPYRSLICEGMQKLILDQFILMKCDTLVVSTSSFARIPAIIHGPKNRFLFTGGKLKKWP